RHTRFSRDWSSDVCSSDLFIQYTITTSNIFSSSSLKCSKGFNNFSSSLITASSNGFHLPLIHVSIYVIATSKSSKIASSNSSLRSEERRVGKECSSRWAEL